MLVVETYLAPSKIHGIGLFASQFIPQGTAIWRFHPVIDHVYTKSKFLKICQGLEGDEEALNHMLNSCYVRSNKCYYITDNARFINHAEHEFNLDLSDDETEVAIRDIHAGEELLENYFLCYDKDDFFGLMDKFREAHKNEPLIPPTAHLRSMMYAYGKNLSR